MSHQDSGNQQEIYVPKPKADVYTGMLVVALVAIGITITCFSLELNEYQWEKSVPQIPKN